MAHRITTASVQNQLHVITFFSLPRSCWDLGQYSSVFSEVSPLFNFLVISTYYHSCCLQRLRSYQYLSIVSEALFPSEMFHKGIAMAEELPSLPIQTLPPCLFKPSSSAVSNSHIYIFLFIYLSVYSRSLFSVITDTFAADYDVAMYCCDLTPFPHV